MDINLIIQKYTPNNLSQIDYHDNIKKNLINLLKYPLNNLILYGPSGSCKKTLIRCFLNDYYHISSYNNLNKLYKYKLSNNYNFSYTSNNYYIEIFPSDYINNNFLALKEFIKNICNSTNILSNSKTIVIYNIELFFQDKTNELILNKYIEKFPHVTFIITSNKYKDVKNCISFRVPALQHFELLKIILYINKKEQLNYSYEKLQLLCNQCNRNLTKLFQSMQIKLYKLNLNNYTIKYLVEQILLNELESFPKIREIIKNIYSKDLYSITQIFEEMTDLLYDSNQIKDKHKLLFYSSKFEFESKNKNILSLEAFIISIYNLMN